MITALKLKYWWLIIPGAILVAWILSKSKTYNMVKSHFEQEGDFISKLKENTGKNLSEWYALISQSGLITFLDIRKWLVNTYLLTTDIATTLTRLYLENLELSKPKILFSSEGRSGLVHYVSKGSSFDMYYEFGGADVLATVDIPSEKQWEAVTKIPLAQRQKTLEFIGQEIVDKQTTSGKGSFEIKDNYLVIRS